MQLPPDMKSEFLARIRAWMEADDGRPFYSLNVMRFHPNGAASNAQYEALVTPMLLKIGAYPTFAGNVSSPNLVGFGPGLDDWSRIAMVRYPSRRALLDLITNPSYQEIEPYKVTALDNLLLIPVNAKIVLPNPALIAGAAAIMAFLAVGWLRAARRR